MTEQSIEEKLEEWGLQHLGGKFMFEPMWLRAKGEIKALITELLDEIVPEKKYHIESHGLFSEKGYKNLGDWKAEDAHEASYNAAIDEINKRRKERGI